MKIFQLSEFFLNRKHWESMDSSLRTTFLLKIKRSTCTEEAAPKEKIQCTLNPLKWSWVLELFSWQKQEYKIGLFAADIF